MPSFHGLRIDISDAISSVSQTNIRGTDISEYVQGIEWHESLITGTMSIRLELLPKTINELEDLCYSDTTRAIRMTTTKDGVEKSTDWRMFKVENAGLYYRGSAPVVKLEVISLVDNLKETDRWCAYTEENVSTILAKIAQRNNLVFDQERAQLSQKGTWFQCGETDWHFIQRIRHQILTTNTQKNVWFYVENQKLITKTIEYSDPAVRNYGIGSGDDRLEDINFRFNGSAEDNGACTLSVIGFDLETKQTVLYTVPDSAVPTLSGRLPREYGSSRKHIVTTDYEITTATAKWIEETSKYFSFNISLPGDVGIGLCDIISVSAVDPDGKESACNGRYPVYEILHIYSANPGENYGLSTYIGGFRKSFNFGNIFATGSNLSGITNIDAYDITNNTENAYSVLTAISLD
jgi:hypothetical protein